MRNSRAETLSDFNFNLLNKLVTKPGSAFRVSYSLPNVLNSMFPPCIMCRWPFLFTLGWEQGKVELAKLWSILFVGAWFLTSLPFTKHFLKLYIHSSSWIIYIILPLTLGNVHKVTLFNAKCATNNSIDYYYYFFFFLKSYWGTSGKILLQSRLAAYLVVGLWYRQEMFLLFLCFKYKAKLSNTLFSSFS